MTGVWTVGVAELAHSRFGDGHGAASLSLLLTATALGAVLVGAILVRWPVRLKVRKSCAVWIALCPGFVLLGTADSLPLALAGCFVIGVASGAGLILVTTAAQESVPDELLGRVMGIILLANVGAKPFGLLLIAPLYAVFDVRTMFVVGGIVAAFAGAAATLAVVTATGAARAAAVVD
jgi:MFS family permease